MQHLLRQHICSSSESLRCYINSYNIMKKCCLQSVAHLTGIFICAYLLQSLLQRTH